MFEKAGIDLDLPLVASCGSGVTASVLAFAAYILHKDVPVYDVSDHNYSVCDEVIYVTSKLLASIRGNFVREGKQPVCLGIKVC